MENLNGNMTDMEGEMVSSYLPFPNIFWWAHAARHHVARFDREENFQKMSYRNRYYISGSNGMIILSIPLQQGRNQRTLMKDVLISNKTPWQIQHWRTLVSVYARSPFFEHYAPGLQKLFDRQFAYLCDFNTASIEWLKEQTGILFKEATTTTYQRQYENATDLRNIKPRAEKTGDEENSYYQVFADRTGFIPNLSILDLLFSEGRHCRTWIAAHEAAIMKWGSH